MTKWQNKRRDGKLAILVLVLMHPNHSPHAQVKVLNLINHIIIIHNCNINNQKHNKKIQTQRTIIEVHKASNREETMIADSKIQKYSKVLKTSIGKI